MPGETRTVKLLDIRDVSKIYGGVRALVGVRWGLDEGTIGIVRGPNGSGKSTLLAIVGTLARPTSGHVDYGPLGRTREEVRRGLGWLGHDSLCYPDLTGRENIELAARLHGVDARAGFEVAVGRFDLGSFVARSFRTYSRGQRQRVALARALVHRPRLLLLDEPTTGLDARACEGLVRVVREEQMGGTTVLVVTHDDAFASALGGVTLRLERGRVVA